MARMQTETKLEIVPGAIHLFPEPGALEEVAEWARDWLVRHLTLAERCGVLTGVRASRTFVAIP